MRDKFIAWCGLPASLADEMAAWQFVGYHMDGKAVAIAALNGTEIHFAIDPKMRLRTLLRDRIVEFLGPIFESKGFLTTRVMKTSKDAARFIKRLGFEKTTSSESFDHYMLSRVPFARTYPDGR